MDENSSTQESSFGVYWTGEDGIEERKAISGLTFLLLGTPRIELDGLPPSFERRKSIALLVYLALTRGIQTRDTLATLLWPGHDQTYARGNLRRVLSTLDKRLREEWLDIDRESVALLRAEGLWVDVEVFQRLPGECRNHGHDPDEVCSRCLELLTEVAELYRDDFLTGFTLADAPEFDQWQTFQTESLRRQMSDALDRLVQGHVAQREWGTAITHARRRVALDSLDEAAQRQLMQVYAWAGDQTAALRQYQIVAELLRRELNARPAPKTVEILQQISEHRLPLPAQQVAPSIAEQPPTTLEPPEVKPMVEGEIRVVTVLCAGLSTREQDSIDPESLAVGLNQLLGEMEEILAPYAAQVDRLLGDSVVAVFGATQVHEDDPERALQAALALREVVRKRGYALTVGVATGEVYFGPLGAGERAAVSAMGPVVNVAARLQAHGASGQVLADKATFRSTRLAFRYISEPLAVSSASGALTVYVLERPRRRATKTRGIEGLRSKLVGREEELAKLEVALQSALHGLGQMVSIIGEAGVGKSRLVAELRSQSPISNLQSPLWLEGRCLEMTGATSYGPFVDLLRAYFAGVAEETSTAIWATLRDLQESGLLASEQVEEIGPLLGNLLSVQFGDDWDERLRHADPQQIRHRTLTALQAWVSAATRSRPLVLVLEDLHWADVLTIDLVGRLMELLPDHSLLLLCVHRPGREHPSVRLETMALQRCPECYVELRLRALTLGQSRQMVESLLAIENLSSEVRRLILEKAQGNPFFIEEIVRSLIDAGIVYREGERWRAREGIESFKAPEGVQSVILDRLDRLDSQEKRTLQIAAVMGRLFRQRALAELAPPTLHLDAMLAELGARDFIYLERSIPEVEYSFKHVLTQEAIYSTLPRQRRTRLHQQAAEVVEQLYRDHLSEHYEELAYHYDRADIGAKAIEYLLKAGEKARRAYLNEEAVRCFQRALRVLETLPDSKERIERELRLQVALGASLTSTKGLHASEVRAAYDRAHALAAQLDDVHQRFVALIGLSGSYFTQGQLQKARGIAEECISLGQRPDKPSWMPAAGGMLGVILEHLGQWTAARAHLEQSLAHSEVPLEPAWVLLYGQYLGMAWQRHLAIVLWHLGYPDQALITMNAALALSQKLAHPLDEAAVLGWSAWLHQFRREAHCARERAEMGITLSKKQNFPHSLAESTIRLGWALAQQGEVKEGIAYMRKGLSDREEMGARLHQPAFLVALAEAYGLAGQPEKGMDCIEEALIMVEVTGERSSEAELYRLKGELLLKQNASNSEAGVCFRQALEIARTQQAKSLELRAAMSLSRLWQKQGRQEEARELLTAVYGWFSEGFDTPDLQEAQALLRDLGRN